MSIIPNGLDNIKDLEYNGHRYKKVSENLIGLTSSPTGKFTKAPEGGLFLYKK